MLIFLINDVIYENLKALRFPTHHQNLWFIFTSIFRCSSRPSSQASREQLADVSDEASERERQTQSFLCSQKSINLRTPR